MNKKNQVPKKLLMYFEKWLAENERLVELCRKSKQRVETNKYRAKGDAVRSVYKYVRGGRWLE